MPDDEITKLSGNPSIEFKRRILLCGDQHHATATKISERRGKDDCLQVHLFHKFLRNILEPDHELGMSKHQRSLMYSNMRKWEKKFAACQSKHLPLFASQVAAVRASDKASATIMKTSG